MDHTVNNSDTSLDLSQQLDAQVNQSYEITTNFGTVQGTVSFIGFDYIELVEASMSTVIVPYENIVSISPI